MFNAKNVRWFALFQFTREYMSTGPHKMFGPDVNIAIWIAKSGYQ